MWIYPKFLPSNLLRSGALETSDLIDSISQYGLLQPLIVRCIDDHFDIVAGYRRSEGINLIATMILRKYYKKENDS